MVSSEWRNFLSYEKDPDRGSEKTDKITEQLANADLKDTGSEDTETEEM